MEFNLGLSPNLLTRLTQGEAADRLAEGDSAYIRRTAMVGRARSRPPWAALRGSRRRGQRRQLLPATFWHTGPGGAAGTTGVNEFGPLEEAFSVGLGCGD